MDVMSPHARRHHKAQHERGHARQASVRRVRPQEILAQLFQPFAIVRVLDLQLLVLLVNALVQLVLSDVALERDLEIGDHRLQFLFLGLAVHRRVLILRLKQIYGLALVVYVLVDDICAARAL